MPSSEENKKSKDTRLKKQIEKELIDRNREYREKAREISAHERNADREERSNQASVKWQEVDKFSEELLQGQRGYENYSALMSQIVILCTKIASAINKSNPLRSLASMGYEGGLKAGQGLSDWLKGIPSVDLPSLQIPVEMKQDGKLDFKSIKESVSRSDGQPLSEEQSNLLVGSVKAWLQYNNCTLNQDFSVAKDNSEMSVVEFNRFRDDPDNGLNKFMTERYDMAFGNTPRPGL